MIGFCVIRSISPCGELITAPIDHDLGVMERELQPIDCDQSTAYVGWRCMHIYAGSHQGVCMSSLHATCTIYCMVSCWSCHTAISFGQVNNFPLLLIAKDYEYKGTTRELYTKQITRYVITGSGIIFPYRTRSSSLA